MSASDCPLCNFSSPSKNLWLSHLRSVHSKDDDFLVVCDIDECGARYSKCASFVSHVYRQHRGRLIEKQPNSTLPQVQLQDVDDDDADPGFCVFSEPLRTDLQHAIDQILQTDDEEQQKKGAFFILNLKEVRGLSQSAIDHIVRETRKVFSHTVGRIKAGVDECLARNSVVPDEFLTVDLSHLFANVKEPFHGIHSTFLQENFYRHQLGCMVRKLKLLLCVVLIFCLILILIGSG